MSKQVPKPVFVNNQPKRKESKKALERNGRSKRDANGGWIGNDRGESQEAAPIQLDEEEPKERTVSPSAFEKRRTLDLPTKSNLVKAKTIQCPHEKNRLWTFVANQRAASFRQGNGFSKNLATPKYRMPGNSINGKHSGQHN